MKEEWKDIPGYEGYYQVSNLGRIKSLLFQNNVWNKKYPREKILKQKFGKDNCSRVELWKNGKHKTYLVYRLVAFTFYNEDIENHELTVNHIDGNRRNNNISNLEIVSLADNIKHAFNTGLMPCKKVQITSKQGGHALICRSLAEASKVMGKNQGYLSCKLKKGVTENENYVWRVLC